MVKLTTNFEKLPNDIFVYVIVNSIIQKLKFCKIEKVKVRLSFSGERKIWDPLFLEHTDKLLALLVLSGL